MSPEEFEQSQHVCSHMCKSQMQPGLDSLQYSLPAFRSSVLQSFSLSAQQPALLVCAQLDKGQEWKASPSCSICDWKSPMEELTFPVTWCCPHSSTTLGLLTEAGAICLPRALHSARIKLQCHILNGHISVPLRWNSLQDCMVPVLVQTSALLSFTPHFNGTHRRTEFLRNTERIYWLQANTSSSAANVLRCRVSWITAKPHLVIQQEGNSTENGNTWKQ